MRKESVRRGVPVLLLPCGFLCLLMALAAPAAAATSLTLVSRTFQNPAAGSDVVVAANASPAAGVTSMDLVFTYDPALLTAPSVFKTGYTNGFSMTSNLTTPGQVEIRLSGGPALAGSGEVAWVLFHVTGAAGSTSPLTWVSASLNGGAIPAQTTNGSVAIQSAAVIVSVPDTPKGLPGTQVQVPISATAFTGGNSFDLWVDFNPAVLSVASVQTATLTNCLNIVVNSATQGTVLIGLYGLCTVSGSGPLAQITFNVAGPLGSRTLLNLTRGGINEGTITTVLDDGMFTVCDPAAAPPTGLPTMGLVKQPGTAQLSWSAVAGAIQYDVVRGGLQALSSSRGNFSTSTTLCLADDQVTRTTNDPSLPTAGDGFWYLVRPENCGGAGSYESEAASQVGLRSPGIQASSAHCP